jgi:hypothetical protein
VRGSKNIRSMPSILRPLSFSAWRRREAGLSLRASGKKGQRRMVPTREQVTRQFPRGLKARELTASV